MALCSFKHACHAINQLPNHQCELLNRHLFKARWLDSRFQTIPCLSSTGIQGAISHLTEVELEMLLFCVTGLGPKVSIRDLLVTSRSALWLWSKSLFHNFDIHQQLIHQSSKLRLAQTFNCMLFVMVFKGLTIEDKKCCLIHYVIDDGVSCLPLLFVTGFEPCKSN